MAESAFKSPNEIAELCGLSRRAIYRAIARGELRATRLCGRLRCHAANVEDWIRANRIEPVPNLKQLPEVRPLDGLERGSLRRMLRTSGGGDR
jgi:excisionase family DNA binding protein